MPSFIQKRTTSKIAPDVVVAVRPLRVAATGLEPRVLIAGVVHHQIGDDPYAAGVRLRHQLGEVRQRAERGQHTGVVGNVVPTVAQR
jgi:hypothetical protein